LFAQGRSCSSTAAELDLSLTVVSKVALRAGYRSRSGPRERYDWKAIAAYYEGGHSKRECREKFGFSAGAWDQAVTRGAIKPRSRPDPIAHAHATRQRISGLLEEGMSQAQIARELGLSKGTVAFHVRNLGVPADSRFSRRYDWHEIQVAYDTGLSAKECCERFGCSGASWSQAVARGDLVPRPREEPLSELLVVGQRRSRFHLKRRLQKAGLKNNRCERCGITEWQGQPIGLELHHVNGNPLDNRLEFLQLLCPNCHSQDREFRSTKCGA
jgi:DNA-binding CsgD family transcriptional regulator